MNREALTKANRIVVKIGTTSLTYPNGKLNLRRIGKLAQVLSDLRNQGKEIVLVSSGAIAVGADRLGLSKRPRDICGKQATSAVGQAVLMQIYQGFFQEYNQKIAQILLTKDVVSEENKRENARNTFFTLFEMGVIPIVNENDTVSIDELEFSDNDSLSSYVACLIESDLLIILSDTDGFFDKDPNLNEGAKRIDFVKKIDSYLYSLAGGSSGQFGTGGMFTKIAAADMASSHNIHTVITDGSNPEIIFDILDGKKIGTMFF